MQLPQKIPQTGKLAFIKKRITGQQIFLFFKYVELLSDFFA